ncbi:unnamed protein product, partial [Mesorhabditis belari]|uniref:G-protein coupled receptors family 1 profile domain-containing protein n=1 Tax=Mesorhabditis belari TaxID=2138241 RepID=A0AAF3ENF2_9BILA
MSNDSGVCLDLNAELWIYRRDVTTLPITMAAFALLYTLIIFVGIVGNSCVILAIWRNKALQTVPNLFILSLSCSDVLVCCVSGTITPITAFKKEWLFGQPLCSIAPWVAGITLVFSTFTLTAISVDRYMLIRHPMKKPLTLNQALMVIAGIATFASLISLPTMLKQRLGPFPNFCGEFCTEDWGDPTDGGDHGRKIYGGVLLIMQFVIPLTIIIISYTAISLRIGQSMILKGTQKNGSCNWEANLTDQQRIALKRRQRTNRMLIAMVVAFSASWFWSVAYNVLRDYNYLPDVLRDQEYLLGIGTHCIAMTSTIWNPILYAMLNLQLRQAFIRLLPAPWRRRFSSDDLEKTSPLINGHCHQNGLNGVDHPSTFPSSTRPKYGATQRITLGIPIDTNGGSVVIRKRSREEKGDERSDWEREMRDNERELMAIESRRGSRLSAIRVIVSKLSSGLSDQGDEDQ